MASKKNGNGVTWKWVGGITVALAVALAGSAWRSLDERVYANEAKLSAATERVAVVEAHYADLVRALARIEAKLDRR